VYKINKVLCNPSRTNLSLDKSQVTFLKKKKKKKRQRKEKKRTDLSLNKSQKSLFIMGLQYSPPKHGQEAVGEVIDCESVDDSAYGVFLDILED
jgi:hypothetical protein